MYAYRAQDEALNEFGIEKTSFEMSIMRNQQSGELMQILQRMQVCDDSLVLKHFLF